MAASTAQIQTTVQYEVRDAIAHVTLDAPPLNILTAAVMADLATAVERAQADRAVVALSVTATGTAFSAGADVGEHRPENAPVMIAAFGACEMPIVMAVDGPALGAGFELALMADILIASTKATFGQPEIRLGFFAPVGVSWLSARVGPARAIEITSTGHAYTAAEMAAMGLVSHVVPPAELADKLASVLGELRRASPAVMRLNVRLVRELQGRPFEAGRLEAEHVFLNELMALDDVGEGIASFFEKRRPVWHNR